MGFIRICSFELDARCHYLHRYRRRVSAVDLDHSPRSLSTDVHNRVWKQAVDQIAGNFDLVSDRARGAWSTHNTGATDLGVDNDHVASARFLPRCTRESSKARAEPSACV